MDPRLLEYYNRELTYIRRLGAEFAAANPKIAKRLRLSPDDAAPLRSTLAFSTRTKSPSQM